MTTRCQRAESGLSSQAAMYLSGSTSVQNAVVDAWQRCREELASASSCASLVALACESQIVVMARVRFITGLVARTNVRRVPHQDVFCKSTRENARKRDALNER